MIAVISSGLPRQTRPLSRLWRRCSSTVALSDAGAVYDLALFKDKLVLVNQEGVLEVYKNYQLIKSVTNLNIPTVYNYGPGLQCDQFSRLLFATVEGLVFFISVKGKYNVMFLDLTDEKMPISRIPSIHSEPITCFHVHICTSQVSLLEFAPAKSQSLLYAQFYEASLRPNGPTQSLLSSPVNLSTYLHVPSSPK